MRRSGCRRDRLPREPIPVPAPVWRVQRIAHGPLRGVVCHGSTRFIVLPTPSREEAAVQNGRGAGAALRLEGVREGAVIAVSLPNVWEYVVLELAIPLLAGVVMPVPLNLS